jgi:hypothetical protein
MGNGKSCKALDKKMIDKKILGENERKLQEKEGDGPMKKLGLLMTVLFLAGCARTTVSETEACFQIISKSDEVTVSVLDTDQTVQSVGELLYVIDRVCRG